MIGAPIVKFLRRFVGHTIAPALTLVVFVVISFLLLYVFIPPLMQQARNLASIDYNTLIKGLEEPLNDWEAFLQEKGIIASPVAATAVTAKSINPKQKHDQITSQVIRLDSILINNGDTILAKQTPVAIILNMENHLNHQEDEVVIPEPETGHFFDKAKANIATYINPSQIQRVFGSIIGFFGDMLVALMAIFFIAFFFLKEQGLFANMLSALVPTDFESQTGKALDETGNLLIRYFIGVATQITLITIFVGVAMGFLGIKNALLIGFFAALMNVIPYLGPALGAAFAVIITISSNLDISFYNEMLPLLLKVLAVFGVMQILDNFFLQPNIFGKSVKAHPLEIFIVVLMGAKLGGIIGMVVAIPAYTVLRVVAKVFLSEFKIVQRITKSLQ